MNFNNDYDSGMSASVRSPTSARRPSSQALMLRQQPQSPMHQQQQQVNNGGTRTPNSRYNTPSKGLPKASYLQQQRRTPGQGTPQQGERTPGGGGSPYSSGNRMNMSMSMTSPSSSLAGGGMNMSTPGRRGSRRGLHTDPQQQFQQQQEYTRMDETLNGGGDMFGSKDSGGEQDHYNDSHFSGHSNDQMATSGVYGGSDMGMRQRGAQSTGGGGGSGGVRMDSQSVTKSLHPHWVIIFGLPSHPKDDSPCCTTSVLKLFQGHGEIDNYHTSPGNWLLIKFSSSLDASNAAGIMHRTFLTSEVMIGVECLTPDLAKKLNLTFQVDGKLIITPGKTKKYNRVEQQGKAHGALLDPDYDNIMRPPRKVTKDVCTRIFEFFLF